MRQKLSTLAALTIVIAATVADAGASARESGDQGSSSGVKLGGGLLRFPDVSGRHICFVYADDVWIVPREGGVATPLASPPGLEYFPRFSPDGETLAFAGNYDGNQDLYTVPTEGGIPLRVTHHPAQELLHDWTADGNLIFSAAYGVDQIYPRAPQLFTVSPKGGMPRRLPVPYGGNGTISPDGLWLAYTPFFRDFRSWKRYRGGLASDIWLFHLEQRSSNRITDWEGTDTYPMWFGDSVYYLSDRGPHHRLNIWLYEGKTAEHRQITQFGDYDVKFPSIGPGPSGGGEIVFQYASALHLLDLATAESHPVSVILPGSRQTIRPRLVDVSGNIHSRGISPTGKRAVVEARGDIWTIPAEEGSPLNLTRTSGTAERYPRWSPDGKWIAYFSDATGEYGLYVRASDGKGAPRRLTEGNENGYRYEPVWSPDSNWIAYKDDAGVLRLLGLEAGEVMLIDREPYYFHAVHNMDVSWSPDSTWIAYTRFTKGTEILDGSHICAYNVRTGERYDLTRGHYLDRDPVFDREGDFLYYISQRHFTSSVFAGGFFTSDSVYVNRDAILAVPLRAYVSYPLAPRIDDEVADGAAARNGGAEQGTRGEEPEAVAIEIDGFESRAIQLPIERGELSHLGVNDKGQLIYLRGNGSAPQDAPAIKLFDVTGRDKKEQSIADGVTTFVMSHDGKKLLAVKRVGGPPDLFQQVAGIVTGPMVIVDAAPNQNLDETLDVSGLKTVIDPRQEWRQIYTEVWRVFRDYFYDAGMHGVDWESVKEQYARMVEDCASREDLTYIIREMIAELNASHTYAAYRDPEVPAVAVGMLGVDFELHRGAYRIKRIYHGAPWDVDARGPLGEPFIDVREGDYLLSVNGIDLDAGMDPWASFQGLGDKIVRLTVSVDPVHSDAEREVVVETISNETELRYRAWIEKNRSLVESRTGGRVGYMHVPNCVPYGLDHFSRQFFTEKRRDALIVDERWNGGGYLSSRYIAALSRPLHFYYSLRQGEANPDPGGAHYGPKCMLINGQSGSDGDLFPAKFRQMKLGKLIGRRTWGGVIGLLGNPQPIDGGLIFVACSGTHTKDGEWTIEGHGVEPDIDVLEDPAQMTNGEDPQLDVAMEHMLEELRRSPYVPPELPAFPDRSGMMEVGEER